MNDKADDVICAFNANDAHKISIGKIRDSMEYRRTKKAIFKEADEGRFYTVYDTGMFEPEVWRLNAALRLEGFVVKPHPADAGCSITLTIGWGKIHENS